EPVFDPVAEGLTRERETRVGEVFDLASSAIGARRYGFPEEGSGSGQPEMMGMGMVFAQRKGEQEVWRHVPISRVAEAVTNESHVTFRREGVVEVRRGHRSWEVPKDYLDTMRESAEMFRQDSLRPRGSGLDDIVPRRPPPPTADQARIRPISFRP
ncbi:hypothetical protein HYS29_02065, partial [Candidatus Microgenomates bacterium]|nr:hypothetical protein [Candidatus Microgenomates bacterium]